jgi:signaling intermediate in Toll pathway protein
VTSNFFENIKDKNKNTYLDMIRIFNTRDVHKRGHVEFIYAAMKYLEEFGVHKDLEVYKSLVDVFPKGKFIPTNIFQAEFQHYPKQQQCAIDLLEKMEDNGMYTVHKR